MGALPKNQQDPDNTTSLIIAPWFLTDVDSLISFINRDSTTEALRWEEYSNSFYHTWRYGADAYNTGDDDDKPKISSYTTIDAILQYVVDHAETRFPALQKITVAGHSAGGQVTQRWALLTNTPKELWDVESSSSSSTTTRLQFLSEPVRVVVANPLNYCYLDARRFLHSLNNDTDDDETFVFRYPTNDEVKTCPTYNSWHYGFSPGGEMDTTYRRNAAKEAGGREEIVRRYKTRHIVYLSGEEDTSLNNRTCNDEIQGFYRRERSERYYDSLPHVYNGEKVHVRRVVPGVNHDHSYVSK